MEFYSDFSKNYDKIFPLNDKKLELIDNTFKNLKEKREDIKLLDVGCGTGNYSIALAKKGYQLKAFDIDAEMISLAESKMKESRVNIDFYRLGMMHIKEKFNSSSFDGIYIIGNVLVHLSQTKINKFLKLAADILNDNGKIFIQIVNYHRILEMDLNGLPTIYSQDNLVRFERDYRYQEQENIIYFITRLIDHFEDKILSENKIELYPLCKDELEEYLTEAGFEIKNIYGSPNGDQYREIKSIPLIMTAEKR